LATKKIGFACKWIDDPAQVNGIKSTDPAKELNTGTTTVAWLNRQTREVAEQRLWDLMVHNIQSTYKLVERVGNLDESLRMVRLSSDILPVYTESTWCSFWHKPDVRNFCEQEFSKVGQLARSRNVRLSFHPGQFTVLASASEAIVHRSYIH
jgi:UV DNA damage repair endonuclease